MSASRARIEILSLAMLLVAAACGQGSAGDGDVIWGTAPDGETAGADAVGVDLASSPAPDGGAGPDGAPPGDLAGLDGLGAVDQGAIADAPTATDAAAPADGAVPVDGVVLADAATPADLTPPADAAHPKTLSTPREYQMGVGAGGEFLTASGRNGVILMGSDVAGIFRSRDYGQTWEIANNVSLTSQTESGMTALYVNHVLWHPTIEKRVILATNDGIFTSDDALSAPPPTWVRRTPGTMFVSQKDRFGCVTSPAGKQLGSIGALTAHVDPKTGKTTLFGVAGGHRFRYAFPPGTSRDLLWVSEDDGATWTYHHITLAGEEACPADTTKQWKRTFIDVEVFDGRVWVAALFGEGILSAPLGGYDGPWTRESVGLPTGCYEGVPGTFPSQLVRHDPDGKGEQLYLALLSMASSCGAATMADGIVFRKRTAAEAWARADATSVKKLPGATKFTEYESYTDMQSFDGKLWAARPNPPSSAGLLHVSPDGVEWTAFADSWWEDPSVSSMSCGASSLWRSKGLDYGPWEDGGDRYCTSSRLYEWYPNPTHQLAAIHRFRPWPQAPEPERLLDIGKGLHEVAYKTTPIPDKSHTRPYKPLTTRESTAPCDVSGDRDHNGNAMRCWTDASAGLPDITAVWDAELFDGHLWVGLSDWSSVNWRYDVAAGHWEEFEIPINYKLFGGANYPVELGKEVCALAGRAGQSTSQAHPDPGAAPCGTAGVTPPLLIIAGGERQNAAWAGGFVVKGTKCGGKWTFTNPSIAAGAKCPTAASPDRWTPCMGDVTDLVHVPAVAGDGTGGLGRFLMAATGWHVDKTKSPPAITGALGLYTSLDGETWTLVPPSADYPDWRDEATYCPMGAKTDSAGVADCLWNGGEPFRLSQSGGETYMSLYKSLSNGLEPKDTTGLWRWVPDGSLPAGGRFARIAFHNPLFGIAAVGKDAEGRLLAAAGYAYHKPPAPKTATSHFGGVHRCEMKTLNGVTGCSWSLLSRMPDYPDLPGELRSAVATDLLFATALGSARGEFVIASFQTSVARSAGVVPLALSEDGGRTFRWVDWPRGFRGPLRLRVFPIGGENRLALLGQAGVYMLDFP